MSDKLINQYLNSHYINLLREEIKKELNNKQTVAEELVPLVIDFSEIRNNTLQESWLRMFGSWVETVLGRMFGTNQIPVTIRGTKSEVESFAKTIEKEKKYIDTWKKYKLNDPRTYKSKAELNNAIKQFEKTTNIKWPFGE